MQPPQPTSGSRRFTSFFTSDDILLIREPITRDALLRQMLERLHKNGCPLTPQACLGEILSREKAGDTVVGHGIALPHGRFNELEEPHVCVAVIPGGMNMRDDAAAVQLVILALIPQEEPALYLQLLKALGKVLANPNSAAEVSRLENAEEVYRFFERGGFVLPEYVCAADVMDTHFVCLRSQDNLSTAIDAFTRKHLSKLPVLDADGDLVGIVSAKELLKVCLPDYLLWMEDLSPIINFQPFVHVMQHEQSTWIADILKEEYPAVQMSDPAIMAAGEMIRYESSVCYVLNGKKLMGIVTLPLFLGKIFRD